MKTICMMTNLFPPVATGSSTQCYALSRELIKHGYRVIVITTRLVEETPSEETIDGVVVYRLPVIRLPRLSIALNFNWLTLSMTPANRQKMRAIFEKHQVDIIHVHNHMFDMALNGAALSRHFNIPLVVTIHTIIKHTNALFNLVLYFADRFFLKHFVINKAQTIICPDFNVDQYVDERFKKHERSIVPYGINLPSNSSPEIAKEISGKYNLSGKRVILSLGHVHALRNRLDLIRAMPGIINQFPNVVLLIVGSVDDERPVKLVKDLGINENVIFTGALSHTLIPTLHALAELEAMWIDQAKDGLNSLGIACMEAMYCGKAVMTVSNENTFGQDVLKNNENVILTQAGRPDLICETICELLADPIKIQTIGESARLIAHKFFSWEKVSEKTLNVYSGAINNFHHLAKKTNKGNEEYV